MRSNGARIAVVVAAVIVAAGALMVLRDSDGGSETASPQTAEQATTERVQATETAEAKPAPRVHRIRVAGGAASGGARRIEVPTGETVRIEVSSADGSDEVHLHGYDVARRFSPGKPARLRFKADIEGEFELELHDAGNRIATLAVTPS